MYPQFGVPIVNTELPPSVFKRLGPAVPPEHIQEPVEPAVLTVPGKPKAKKPRKRRLDIYERPKQTRLRKKFYTDTLVKYLRKDGPFVPEEGTQGRAFNLTLKPEDVKRRRNRLGEAPTKGKGI